MSEMVARVAKAIDPLVEDLCKERGVSVGEIRDIARAAIEAMREPTAEMLNKGIDCLVDDIKIQWQAMIDEALK